MGNTPRSRSKFSWKGNGCARLVTEKLRLTVIEIAFNCRYLHLPPSTRWSRSWTRAWRTADSRPSCSEQFQRPEMDSSGCNWSRQAGGQRSDWDLDWWTSDPKKNKTTYASVFFLPTCACPPRQAELDQMVDSWWFFQEKFYWIRGKNPTQNKNIPVRTFGGPTALPSFKNTTSQWTMIWSSTSKTAVSMVTSRCWGDTGSILVFLALRLKSLGFGLWGTVLLLFKLQLCLACLNM